MFIGRYFFCVIKMKILFFYFSFFGMIVIFVICVLSFVLKCLNYLLWEGLYYNFLIKIICVCVMVVKDNFGLCKFCKIVLFILNKKLFDFNMNKLS